MQPLDGRVWIVFVVDIVDSVVDAFTNIVETGLNPIIDIGFYHDAGDVFAQQRRFQLQVVRYWGVHDEKFFQIHALRKKQRIVEIREVHGKTLEKYFPLPNKLNTPKGR